MKGRALIKYLQTIPNETDTNPIRDFIDYMLVD